ncbi:hypothetical protein LINPERHAP2_LOCUS41842, partial [Linum perenne]
MDYMFGEVPVGVRSGSPEDPSILWGDADRHRASEIFEAQNYVLELLGKKPCTADLSAGRVKMTWLGNHFGT